MKQRNFSLRALSALLLLFLCSTLLLSSCHNNARSVIGTSVNDAGELILSYSDGTTENLGLVKGESGENGAPGLRGAAGKKGKDGVDGEKGDPGKDGQNGVDGANGVITVVPDSDTVSLACAKGLRSSVSIECEFPLGTSAGSGVIYQIDRASGDALVITNYHVVYHSGRICNNINLYLYAMEYDNFAIPATYVGGSMYYDIAVLLVKGSDVIKRSDATAVTVGDSEQIRVGDGAIAIGNPKNLGISASFGIVSVESEQLPMVASDGMTTVSMRVMRIDTAVNSGNSGGGLFNHAGELIGIVNAKIMLETVENIGYAIPSNLAVAVAENIIDHCLDTSTKTVMRASLGVTVAPVDVHSEYDATSGRLCVRETVAIQSVTGGSIAEGKLFANDIVLSVAINDEQPRVITHKHHVLESMLDMRAGDTVTVVVLRGGSERTVTLAITSAHLSAY